MPCFPHFTESWWKCCHQQAPTHKLALELQRFFTWHLITQCVAVLLSFIFSHIIYPTFQLFIFSLRLSNFVYNSLYPPQHSESLLRMGYNKVPYLRTFKLQTFKEANVHLVPAGNQNLCHQRQTWVKLQPAPLLLLLTALQLYHLPPLPSAASNSSCLFTQRQPLHPAAVLYHCTFQGPVM